MPNIPVSSTVDEDLFQRARSMTQAGNAETIRRALQHFVDSTAPAAPAVAEIAVPAALPATKPVSAMTPAEKKASLMLMIKTRQAVQLALVHLVGEEAVATTANKAKLRIAIGDLEAQNAKINAKITAFQAGQLTMVPPTQEMVDRVSQEAAEVGRLTAQAQQSDLIVAAAKSIIDTWTETQV